MNNTQLAVGMTVYAKENKSIWNITKDKPYKLLEPRNNFYKGAVFGFIDDLGLERIIGIKLLNKYFTTTPPDQEIKQQALAQCDEALKLNSQIGNFGKPNDKDNKPDQEGGSSGLLNGFNDGLHRSSGIGGQSPELSTLDQEGKREEPYHEIIDSTEELISQLQSRVKELENIIKGLVNENERIAKLAKVDPIMKCEKPVPCTDGHDVSEGSSTCSKCGERYIHNPTHRPDKR